MNDSYYITAEECKQIQKEYEIAEILINLHKALMEVGDVKISEGIAELSEKTRFPVEWYSPMMDLSSNAIRNDNIV